MSRDTNSIIRSLIKLGVRPKYVAFDYVFFVLSNYDTTDLVRMKYNDIINLIAAEFNTKPSKISSGIANIIGTTMKLNTQLSDEMPCLEDNEKPSLKEYLLLLSILVDEDLN